MMPVGPASSPSGVFLLSEAFSFEKAPEQVPSELPKVSETFLICPLMLGPPRAQHHNIIGEVCGKSGQSFSYGLKATGPFFEENVGYSAQDVTHVSAKTIGFDASRNSSVFGKASSVQPSSLRFLPCIKT